MMPAMLEIELRAVPAAPLLTSCTCTVAHLAEQPLKSAAFGASLKPPAPEQMIIAFVVVVQHAVGFPEAAQILSVPGVWSQTCVIIPEAFIFMHFAPLSIPARPEDVQVTSPKGFFMVSLRYPVHLTPAPAGGGGAGVLVPPPPPPLPHLAEQPLKSAAFGASLKPPAPEQMIIAFAAVVQHAVGFPCAAQILSIPGV